MTIDPSQFRTPEQWRAQLTPQEYHVLREAGTEAPFIGEYTDTTTEGVYRCKGCDAQLFRSTEKFPALRVAVVLRPGGCRRRPVRRGPVPRHRPHRGPVRGLRLASRACFRRRGYDTPTDLRYCINSICLVLEPTSE